MNKDFIVATGGQPDEDEFYQLFSKALNSFFANVSDAVLDKRVFIHCAADKRVSVFLALYR